MNSMQKNIIQGEIIPANIFLASIVLTLMYFLLLQEVQCSLQKAPSEKFFGLGVGIGEFEGVGKGVLDGIAKGNEELVSSKNSLLLL